MTTSGIVHPFNATAEGLEILIVENGDGEPISYAVTVDGYEVAECWGAGQAMALADDVAGMIARGIDPVRIPEPMEYA